MKITKDLLKEMIEEEMKIIKLGIGEPIMAHGYMGGQHGMEIQEPVVHGDRPKDPDGYEGSMAKNNLFNLKQDAAMLCELIQDDDNLEPWVEEKIAVAASMMNSVARHMKAEKYR
jgi:hypothetical protein